jgi:hypothetical protein
VPTPPTISSSAFTPYGIFGIAIANSTCVHDIPCALLLYHDFFFHCRDDTPTSHTPWCYVSCSSSGSRPYCAKYVACSLCCGPFPLDASNCVLSTSSSGFSASCDMFPYSLTYMLCVSYSDVWISSTSTTMGMSCIPVCFTRALLLVFRPVLLGAPTRGGDILLRFRLLI